MLPLSKSSPVAIVGYFPSYNSPQLSAARRHTFDYDNAIDTPGYGTTVSVAHSIHSVSARFLLTSCLAPCWLHIEAVGFMLILLRFL